MHRNRGEVETRIRELSRLRPRAIGLGAHGCDTEAECAELRDALIAKTGLPVHVVNDAFLLTADESRPSAGLVTGTGSIAVARDASGNAMHAGGWGWLLGDPGSAWGTVREAVRALHRAGDRGELNGDPLLPMLLHRSRTGSLREIARRMQQLPAREWADWALEVFAAANHGSPAARAAIDSGAGRLADTIGDLLHRGARIDQVIASGSVVTKQPSLAERIRELLHEHHRLPLRQFHGELVAGAVALAHQLVSQ